MSEPRITLSELDVVSRPVCPPPAARFGTSRFSSTGYQTPLWNRSTLTRPPDPEKENWPVRLYVCDRSGLLLMIFRAAESAWLKSVTRSANVALFAALAGVTVTS